MKSDAELMAAYEMNRIFVLLQGSLALSGKPHAISQFPECVHVRMGGAEYVLRTYAEGRAWLEEHFPHDAARAVQGHVTRTLDRREEPFPWWPLPLLVAVCSIALLLLARFGHPPH